MKRGEIQNYLKILLGDVAILYIKSLPELKTQDFKSLCGAMEERFVDSLCTEIYCAELKMRRFLVWKLTLHAYPCLS